jgi:hypothetical protein
MHATWAWRIRAHRWLVTCAVAASLLSACGGGREKVSPEVSANAATPQSVRMRPASDGSVVLPDGAYRVRNACAGRYLGLRNAGSSKWDDAVVQDAASPNAIAWQLQRQPDGHYRLAASTADIVLQTSYGATANETNVDLWSDDATLNQRWAIEDMGQGSMRLTVAAAPGMVLDAKWSGNGSDDVWLYGDNGSCAQRWQFEPAGTSPVTGDKQWANATSPLGMNLNGVTSYSTERPFIDAMKGARAWISGSASAWDDQRAIAQDPQGWVTKLQASQLVRTILLDDGGHYRPGRYVLRFEGTGDFELTWDASVIEKQAGRWVLDLKPAGGVLLTIRSIDPANPLRNIRLVPEGGICAGDPFTGVTGSSACTAGDYLSYEENAQLIVFDPQFLERMRPIRALRFMGWTETNGSTQASWTDRPLVSDFSWGRGRGVPVEVMVQLANVLHAEPWFNMPHLATDDYVRSFAAAVRRDLSADLRTHVEHSNEVWNGQFAQAQYAAQRGAELGLGAANDYATQLKYHALRTREISALWHEVWGDAAQRVVRVLGAQAANAWTTTMPLQFLGERFGSVGVDAVAIAPYFGVMPDPQQAAEVIAAGVDGLVRRSRDELIPQVQQWVAEHQKETSRLSLRLVAYEGGQHMVGLLGAENDQALTDTFHAFNRDPRIEALYTQYMTAWKDGGGELFMHFVGVGAWSKWGSWGAAEYLSQPLSNAPKLRSLLQFAQDHPAWWKN